MLYTRLYIALAFFFLLSNQSLFARTEKYRCMWRENPSTSMVIGWNQLSGVEPKVYYGLEDGGTNVNFYPHVKRPDRFVPSKGMNNYFARLTGLQPGTTYYLIIADSDGTSRRLSFRTAPDDPNERLSIIAGGDSRNYREARRKANKMVGKLKPHFVMFGGDMTGGDNATQWKAWMEDWQHTITSEGRLTPIVVTRGNHEYSNRTLVDLFDVKSKSIYYALTFGGDLLRVYTLNSLIACGGNQRDWLEDDLANNRHVRWKTAQYHFAIRPHTRKKRERNDQWLHWASLFDNYDVNLVVESDAHCVKTTYPLKPSRAAGSDEGFIRNDADGTVYVGEGCWGAPLRRNDDDKAWTRNSGSFNQFKWVFVDQDKMEVRTVMTDNTDYVDEVDINNPFFPPNGISIWQPSNGPVIYIRPKESNQIAGSMLASTSSVPMFTSNKQKDMQVLAFNADVQREGVILQWKTQFEPIHKLNFEVQRSVNGGDFRTMAQVAGQGNAANQYKIMDRSSVALENEDVSYRLVHNYANGHPRVQVASQTKKTPDPWKDFQSLSSDPNTGMLRVKYALEGEVYNDVKIRLINTNEEAISKSEYKNQRPGNFLKSINMKKFPNGRYLLIIEVGEKVIRRYRVTHGV